MELVTVRGYDKLPARMGMPGESDNAHFNPIRALRRSGKRENHLAEMRARAICAGIGSSHDALELPHPTNALPGAFIRQQGKSEQARK